MATQGTISGGTGDLGGERASRDVFVIKLDHDVVIPAGGGKVGHCARPIFVVLTGDLSFRWTLHSERQTTCMDSVPVMLALPTDLSQAHEELGLLDVTFSAVFSHNGECGQRVHSPVSQTGTKGRHVTTVNGIDVELERTSCSRET